jgi:hypothetical protein
MKKIFVGIITVVLLFGCASKSEIPSIYVEESPGVKILVTDFPEAFLGLTKTELLKNFPLMEYVEDEEFGDRGELLATYRVGDERIECQIIFVLDNTKKVCGARHSIYFYGKDIAQKYFDTYYMSYINLLYTKYGRPSNDPVHSIYDLPIPLVIYSWDNNKAPNSFAWLSFMIERGTGGNPFGDIGDGIIFGRIHISWVESTTWEDYEYEEYFKD